MASGSRPPKRPRIEEQQVEKNEQQVLERMKIKFAILKAEELDCCFLLDGTMRDFIDVVKEKMANIMNANIVAFPKCKLRFSFVVYGDDIYDHCDFTTDFSGSESKFMKALSVVCIESGPSDTADISTGLSHAGHLKWQAGYRLLVHFCAAPNFSGSITDSLIKVYKHCDVAHYYFIHLNDNTTKIVQELKNVVTKDGWITEVHFQDIKNIPESITISRSTSHTRFVDKDVWPHPPRTWEKTTKDEGERYNHIWYDSLEQLLEKISNKDAFETQRTSLKVQVVIRPFSTEGTSRWPYYANIVEPKPERMVIVKTFKKAVDKNVSDEHLQEQYLCRMEIQTVAAHMAHEFNHNIQSEGLTEVKKVEFTQVSTLYVGRHSIYHMEEYLPGERIRYPNNAGYVNIADYAATLQAFTHWTHERSSGMLMVTDLYGVKERIGDGKEYKLLFYNPTIHCLDVFRFSQETNLGDEGFQVFFKAHTCNHICRHLGLKVVSTQ